MQEQRILIIVHQHDSTPGRVGQLLEQRGFVLERCCPCIGDPLPSDLSRYAASVIFGGPQSANDDHVPGIRAELEWIERVALPSDRPLLGICLGAQALARVLGAQVGAHPDGWVEIGYHPVLPTADGGSFLKHPAMFYQWHSETFDIPYGAVHLAENERFPGQAFCYERRAYGIEFHPEMTLEMIDRWCTSESGAWKLALNGATPHIEQQAGYQRYAQDSDRWLDEFLNTLLIASVRTTPVLNPARESR